MSNSGYKKVTAAIVSAWFVFALTAGALNVFNNGVGRLGVGVGLAALIPMMAFGVWYATSAGFREFTMSLSPRVLTALHTWRIGGLRFVLLYLAGGLPGIFALPAGLGDMAVGATALLVAARYAKPEHRRDFIVWQSLGIFDLVLAVTLGTTAGILSPGADMTRMTVLPLSLIPTFAVPLLIMLHFICIAQARRWAEPRGQAIGKAIQSAA